MSAEQAYTVFSFSRVGTSDEDRWAQTGISDVFFDDEETTRRAILELREDVAESDGDWRPMRIERIETLPMTKDRFLALLNDGMGAIVSKYEILETIG